MRVLVDTTIWIDHLRKTEPVLVDLLERDQVCVHQSVITELALGNLKNRSIFLKALERLMIVRNVDDQGVRHFVEERRLWGRGLSAVDAALLASVVVSPGVSLWTRDKRLRQAARDVGVLAELD
ncbi:MAG: type II toxin-antitoxin system VapC family toxin [Actinomyces bouchesdurhonensis]|uniref:Ribonuclease VapC n=1 Tax=Actinomyces bouchesdurhonensis TaxID=1852361 RepID=A0A929RR58_9ACTO|nr:type II toxin-antitoxin system VapC family toxin [Actinomyces bouchesdurhonensis]